MKHILQSKYVARNGTTYLKRCNVCLKKWKTNKFDKECKGKPVFKKSTKDQSKKDTYKRSILGGEILRLQSIPNKLDGLVKLNAYLKNRRN